MSEKVTRIASDNFEQDVLECDIPVLLDFWADWCGPCKMIAPVIDEIAEDYDGRIKVGKVNIDEQNELAAKYRIASIPTIMIFKDGAVVDKAIGAQPKAALEAMINKHI